MVWNRLNVQYLTFNPFTDFENMFIVFVSDCENERKHRLSKTKNKNNNNLCNGICENNLQYLQVQNEISHVYF